MYLYVCHIKNHEQRRGTSSTLVCLCSADINTNISYQRSKLNLFISKFWIVFLHFLLLSSFVLQIWLMSDCNFCISSKFAFLFLAVFVISFVPLFYFPSIMWEGQNVKFHFVIIAITLPKLKFDHFAKIQSLHSK